MCVINETCTIFFDSTHIPIIVLDKNLNSLYKVGHTKESSILITSINIKNTLAKATPTCSCISLDTSNSMIATYIKRKFTDNESLYFIIGPVYISNTLKIYDNPCRSKECIGYLTKFLSLIFDNVMSNYTFKYSPCVKKAIELVHKNYTDNINIDSICHEINISKSYFCNIFKKETGSSFITYLNLHRIENSKPLLKNTSSSILDISIAMGYQSQSYFCRSFKKYVGISPIEYRTKSLIL